MSVIGRRFPNDWDFVNQHELGPRLADQIEVVQYSESQSAISSEEDYVIRRLTTLLGVLALLIWVVSTPAVRAARAFPICESAHATTFGQDSYDPGVTCLTPLSGSDLDVAEAAIAEIFFDCETCGAIRDALQNGSINEWTGWNETVEANGVKWWDAAAFNNGPVGFHHDYLGDTMLWAHEGAHVVGYGDELAEFWSRECTTLLPPPAPKPAPTVLSPK